MPDPWFDPIAETLHTRLSKDVKHIEFVVGIRVNGAPHIGTYLTLASTFIFAELTKQRTGLPASVHIHFLDNDPAIGSNTGTHFHSVFQKRSASDAEQFLKLHYFAYLDALRQFCGCNYTFETYSSSQLNSEFRSAVLKSLGRWKDFKYYVSGPPPVGSPSGVRGIGSPCSKCGLFDGWMRPEIDFDSEKCVILESSCRDHGRYSALLTSSNDTFINLETTFRNAVKEIVTLNRSEVLPVMIKGHDWQEGVRNVNSVLEILSIDKNKIPLRFLVPVVKTKTGTKLSKSAIQKFSYDFVDVSPTLLDMNIFREQTENYPEVLIRLTKQILNVPNVSISVDELSW